MVVTIAAPTSALAPAPRPRRLGVRRHLELAGPLGALTVISWAATAGAPWLRHEPLVLIALCPKMIFLFLTAPNVGFVPFVVVATLRLCLADPFSYRAGTHYGEATRAKVARWRLGRWCLGRAMIERAACAVAVAVRPSQTMLMWAGSLRLGRVYVATVDLVTTTIYVVLIHRAVG
jgi:hypothetical protein